MHKLCYQEPQKRTLFSGVRRRVVLGRRYSPGLLPISLRCSWPRRIGPLFRPRVAPMQLDRVCAGCSAAPDTDVQQFDENGETHGEVDVALGDVLVEAFEDKSQTDQQQEAQGEHLQGGVAVDHAGDGLGGDQHDQYGDRDGRDHHRDLIYHAHGGYTESSEKTMSMMTTW